MVSTIGPGDEPAIRHGAMRKGGLHLKGIKGHMRRVFLVILDGFGLGGAPDAADYGDQGANTLAHIAAYCAALPGLRFGLETMLGLGLGHAALLAAGQWPAGLKRPDRLRGYWGCASETSKGKDTPSGHWEIAGAPVNFDWGYFPPGPPSFPRDLVEELKARAGLPDILGNCAASGTQIIADLGEAHCRTGAPICYTSADSVFQIAAHETAFGLARLHDLCALAHQLTVPLKIGRVIARPFIGTCRDNFLRTANRRDFAMAPHEPTMLDAIAKSGGQVCAIGKIRDIFSGCGISRHLGISGNSDAFDALMKMAAHDAGFDLVFANFGDFDTLFGHRRDVPGFARALQEFDERLPALMECLGHDDLLILAADHGCDPTWKGTQHTRERVPVLCYAPGFPPRDEAACRLGIRSGFADISATILAWLGLPAGRHGISFSACIDAARPY